jgi:hypothetical protein
MHLSGFVDSQEHGGLFGWHAALLAFLLQERQVFVANTAAVVYHGAHAENMEIHQRCQGAYGLGPSCTRDSASILQ